MEAIIAALKAKAAELEAEAQRLLQAGEGEIEKLEVDVKAEVRSLITQLEGVLGKL